MRWGIALAVAFLCQGGCDCGVEPAAKVAARCLTDAECDTGFCRDGTCQIGLPVEGEGETGEGEGEAPQASFVIAPASLVLAPPLIGQSSTGSAQIVNTGDVSLTLSALTSSNAAFVVTAPAVGTRIDASTSLPLDIRFTAATEGEATATITVTADGVARTLPVSSSAAQTIEDGALILSAGPDDDGVGLPACECSTAVSPANVDIVYAAAGGTCRKPASLDCGVSDSCLACNLGAQGSARWRSGRTENPRQRDAAWIVDEEIVHQGAGADGDFVFSATLVDDCTTTVASIGSATNHSCCAFLDCPGAQACYAYAAPVSCVTDCEALVTLAESQDCMARGPVLVRAKVDVGVGAREFCLTMQAGQTVEIASVQRRAGAFSLSAISDDVVEVAAGAPCP